MCVLTVFLILNIVGASVISIDAADKKQESHNPAAWGNDHVGQSFPEYVTGDECLFCHRRKIGPAWQANAHQRTMRPPSTDDPAVSALSRMADGETRVSETQFVLGSRRLTRFLKRSEEYGKLDLLTALYRSDHSKKAVGGELKNTTSVHWDTETFANRCAGCHTTAADSTTGAFAATSLDCFVCHGDVDLAHTNDPGKVFLSTKNRDPRQVTSTCGQCHLRGGRSKSSGRPWPATFVAGDNLFRDFDVDLTGDHIDSMPRMERHIYQNARDVAISGQSNITCLNCHDVHKQSSEKHAELVESQICVTCHLSDDSGGGLHPDLEESKLKNHSAVCDY